MGFFGRRSTRQRNKVEIETVADEYLADPRKSPTRKSKKSISKTRDTPEYFRPSEVRDHDLKDAGFKSKRSTTVPSARTSAYSGPPRYDWIDVEAAAAIKIQAAYRRYVVITQLKDKGISTAAMRNEIRARNAKKSEKISDGIPSFLRFCGVGLLFADATGEDTAATTETDTIQRDKEFNAKIVKDKRLRAFRMRKKATAELEEAVEVVDNVN